MLSATIILLVKDALEAMGVAVIAYGGARSAYQLITYLLRGTPQFNRIRLEFGYCVILGLEFMVGGDVVGSLVNPDYHSLAVLGAIVVIRTILSVFLNKELEALSPEQRHAIT